MDRSIKIVRQLGKVFETCRMKFKQLNGKRKQQLISQCFCKRKEKSEDTKTLLFGGGKGGLPIIL
jgi:hypothetical protein